MFETILLYNLYEMLLDIQDFYNIRLMCFENISQITFQLEVIIYFLFILLLAFFNDIDWKNSNSPASDFQKVKKKL